MSEPRQHREVERKFRVDDAFTLPELGPPGCSARAEEPVDLVAVYHDTEALALIRWHTTLRRREGGADAGWHLKLPVAGSDPGTRDELHLPLTVAPAGQVPAALADIVAPLVRDATLVPVATVRTHRRPRTVVDADERPVLEVVDDAVEVRDLRDEPVARFREIEVEVIDHEHPAAEQLLDAVAAALLQAGAEPSSLSKAASALGARAGEPADVPELVVPEGGGLAVDALAAALAEHTRRLILADVGVRRDLPDSVHQMRVAARRLRSVLRTFAPLLEPHWSQALSEELRWMANELGAIRDTEVMQERLDAHTALLADADAESARAAIDEMLGRRLAAARSSALAALRSDRHTWLLDDLVAAVAAPPVTDAAYQPAIQVLPPLAQQAWKRLVREVRRVHLDSDSAEWHRVRILAKRARYSVDALVETGRARIARFAAELARTTELLGEHQDAVVAQHTLRVLADQATGSQAFALGLLHAVETTAEHDTRVQFLAEWPSTMRSARKSGMV